MPPSDSLYSALRVHTVTSVSTEQSREMRAACAVALTPHRTSHQSV
jgi:hypothetical protein